jgi:hypothetical protein
VPSSETFQAVACAVLTAVYEVATSRALSAEDSGHYSSEKDRSVVNPQLLQHTRVVDP